MSKPEKQRRKSAIGYSNQNWTKKRRVNSAGLPQFVYRLGNYSPKNIVTLPRVKGFFDETFS